MKDWLARKRQEWTREHPPLSSYSANDLVYVTTGGTYQGKIGLIGSHTRGGVEVVDPYSLKPLTTFMSADCISPALEHESQEVLEKPAGKVYFMTNEVVLRRDAEAKPLGEYSPVYKIISVSNTTGGVKLENIATNELLTAPDGEPEIIMTALELRPPTSDESRHARNHARERNQAQVSGPDNAEVSATILDGDAATGKEAANSQQPPFNLRETLNELGDSHKLLAHHVGRLKIRTPFKQALAAEKAGKELAADQRSAVDFIHAMEDALERARAAERALFDHKDELTAGPHRSNEL